MKHLEFHKQAVRFFGGHDVVVVGGTVRDRLLHRDTIDLDVVTPKNPKNMAHQLAKKMTGRAFPLDEERGIYRITIKDEFHLDLAQRQGKNLIEDIDRRDFSVNAMAVPISEWLSSNWKAKIIDRHQGHRDLEKKQIRAISTHVFQEDPLRLLRAFRQAAELHFSIEKKTIAAVGRSKKALTAAAPERVREELMRLFSTADAYTQLNTMDQTGLLDVVFPEAAKLRKSATAYYGKGGVLKHTLESVKQFEDVHVSLPTWFARVHKQVAMYLNESIGQHPRYAHLKWGLLLHDIGKPDTAKKIKGRLRFFEHEHVGAKMIPEMASRYRWSNDETHRFSKLVRNHMRPGNLAAGQDGVTDRAIHRFFRDLGEDALGMLLLSLGDHLTYLTPAQLKKRNSAHEKTTITMVQRYFESREKILPAKIVNGHDIMKTFKLKPSPLIGQLLNDLMEAQSEGKITSKKAALEYLRGKIPLPGRA